MELIDSLPEVNSACTYGSGFFMQDGSFDDKQMDLMISVDNPSRWHMQNYYMNNHMYDRAGFAKLTSFDYDSFPKGLGAFFTEFKGKNYKLVVVDKRLLYKNLETWEHFSLPGRFQKPMRMLVDNSNGKLPKLMRENYDNAIKTVLLTKSRLPFRKKDLYEDITSLSYMGDMRVIMHFENPNKVKDIVFGAYKFYEEVYGKSDLYDYLGDYIMRKDDIDNKEIIDSLPSSSKNYLLDNLSSEFLKNDILVAFMIKQYLGSLNFMDSISMALRCRETVGTEKTLYTILDKGSKGILSGFQKVKCKDR